MDSNQKYQVFRKAKSHVRKVSREIWPINFKRLRNVPLLSKTISSSSYFLKVSVGFLSVIFIISSGFFIYSLYIVSTKEVAQNGGVVREAVRERVNIFNPLLSGLTDSERRVTTLLYHPLYTVEYPDYSTESGAKATIEPVLLEKIPEFIDLDKNEKSERYKTLKMELKNNIHWSDGNKITMRDLQWSFRKLQGDGGSEFYNGLFRGLNFKVIDDNTFYLVSKVSNPNLINLAGFTPISRNYNDSLSISGMRANVKSRLPEVTSGHFTLKKNINISNPFSDKKLKVSVLKNLKSGDNELVVLSKNLEQDVLKKTYLNNYSIKRYWNLKSQAGKTQLDSVEKDASNGLVDIFISNADFNSVPGELEDLLKLKNKSSKTNQYYEMFLNSQVAPPSLKYPGYTVNKSLRKYISCHLINYNYHDSDYFSNVKMEDRIVPLELNKKYSPDCGDNLNNILDEKHYKVREDTKGGRVVFFNGSELTLDLIGHEKSQVLLLDIKKYFLDVAGIKIDITSNEIALERKLNSKKYHIALLPTSLISQDLYPKFGEKGNNFSAITSSNRFKTYSFEENLLKYSESVLDEKNKKAELENFFMKEYVNINILKVRQSVLYSSRVQNLQENLPDFYWQTSQIYQPISKWYTKTGRELNI